jgi:hypothetical protein
MKLLWNLFAIVCFASPSAWGANVESLGSVALEGEIFETLDLSAVGLIDNRMIVGSDEGATIQILDHESEDKYRIVRNVPLNATQAEVDVEGIACDGNTVYVIGSHSQKRKKLSDKKSFEKNLEAMQTIIREPSREKLYRFQIDADGNPSPLVETSLMPTIVNDPILKNFTSIPGKENGVDIEGIAVRNGLLYIGFRGPVLRGNYVTVLTGRFETEFTLSERLFVNLDGNGIRDILAVSDGFLILSGPVGDGDGTYRFYRWDGNDCLPGNRDAGKPVGKIASLGKIDHEKGVKPEGMTLLAESETSYDVLIVHDAVEGGRATKYRVAKTK